MHKTVHHYLMRFLGGELSDDDVEVSEVAWVPLGSCRRGWPTPTNVGWPRSPASLIDRLHADGPAALPPLPPTSPRRRPETHSHTRNRRPDESAQPQPGRRTNGCGPGP